MQGYAPAIRAILAGNARRPRRQTVRASTRRRGATFTPQQRKAIKRIRDAGKETNHMVHGTYGVYNMTSTPSLTGLTSAITQGDGQGERIGDRINLTSVKGNIRMFLESTAVSGEYDFARYTLIQWHPDTAVETPSTAKIFENANIHLSQFTTDKIDRAKFTVLYDKQFGASFNGNRQGNFDILATKLKDIQFNEGTTTGRNHIYEVYAGSHAAGTNNMNLQHMLVIRYKDM